jgi:hypothetical protein
MNLAEWAATVANGSPPGLKPAQAVRLTLILTA